ncbi:MAG TPA: ABC transporter ATP-binding protein [Methylomirabilota bacterium]|nr:ABC transporter ATP-binding protein [Methylomirabilota bacterium]
MLTVRDLRVSYRTGAGPVRAVKGVSFVLPPGRVLGLVGESGSGKSTVALAVMGALFSEAEVTGEVRFRGENLVGQPARELRRLWGRRLAMVFQDPTSTLNPVLTVGDQLVEVLVEHERLRRAEARARMLDLFAAVQLPNPAQLARRYPHQLSGGQQQRVSIATALACDPDLLVLDEPTTGLDVTTEARILDLVDSLRQRTAAGILYITHNLGVIARLADEVAVMYAGEIAEHGPVGPVFTRPRHPYTVGLLGCLPRVDRPAAARLLPAIEGTLPDPRAEVRACQFAPRCPLADARCRQEHPGWFEAAPDHRARCFYWDRVPPPDAVRAPAIAAAVAGAAPRSVPLLDVVHLVHHYRQAGGLAGVLGRAPIVRAVDGVSLAVAAGETLAVVGESGSGKTTTARCVVGLLQPTAGRIEVDGRPVPRRPAARPRALRRRLQIVFQNPDLTLNPRRTILEAVARPLTLFGLADRRSRRAAAARLLESVGLETRYLDVFPAQLSGGQRQRVAIARAFACRPDLVVCDEPTSALDVSVQATVLNLLASLQARAHTSYLFISHDLSVVRHIADRVVVLYLGRIVEAGTTEDVFRPPWHPYTEALLSAVPSLSATPAAGAIRLVGPAPNPAAPPSGCPFHPRCPRKVGPICEREAPPVVTGDRGHAIVCHIPRADLLHLQTPV